MAQIFISYNRQTKAITKALVEDVEALGYTVWFDQELSGGQAWWNQILSMIRLCDLFVFVLDPAALNSIACKREYGYAADLQKPIIPVLVSEGVSTNLLPPSLSQIQFVDYRHQDRTAALRLARAFSTVPPPAALPEPLPIPPEVPISYLGSLAAKVEATSLLTYEEQSVLVFDLKRTLRDPETADDTRTLLKTFRKRRDLLVGIAEEIDELFEGLGETSSAQGAQPKIKKFFAVGEKESGVIRDAGRSSAETGRRKDRRSRSRKDLAERSGSTKFTEAELGASGNAATQFDLGLRYATGQGVPQDLQKAAELYQEAADQGHALAQYNLGVLYVTGQGVPQALQKAAELFQKAADQGDADAQYNLGVCYEHGQGVPQDLQKARELYQKAADQGTKSAIEKLERLSSRRKWWQFLYSF
jgi:hypothetical protein